MRPRPVPSLAGVGLVLAGSIAFGQEAQKEVSRRTGLSETRDPPRLKVSGNVVFSAQVYEGVVGLPARTPIDAAVARKAEVTILRFLRRSGYDLARVAARPGDGVVEVVVDEGRLDQIVFPDQDALRAMGMKLALDLPSDVFNRVDFEAQLPDLENQFGVTIQGYELVPAMEDPRSGFELMALPGFKQLSDWLELPQPGQWNLFVYASREELPPGLEFDADAEGPDGLVMRLVYRWRSLFAGDDRFEIAPEVGLRVQDIVEDPQGRRPWSRLGGSLRYLTPAIGRSTVRPYVWPRAIVINRQRLDLDLPSYDYFLFEGLTGVVIPITPGFQLGLGAGVQVRNLLDVTEGDTEPPLPRVDPNDGVRGIFGAVLRFQLGSDRFRIDRRHRIRLEGRAYVPAQEQQLGYLRLTYDKTFAFGYDDFIIGFDTEGLYGDVAFTEEIRVADHLRGLFGDNFYTDGIGSLRLEYRYALVREFFKIGLFHDLALFRGVDRETGREFPRLANAFGPGVHALLFDTFQFSLYGVFGFMTDEKGAVAAALNVTQLF